MVPLRGIWLFLVTSQTMVSLEDIVDTNSCSDNNNCASSNSFIAMRTINGTQNVEAEINTGVFVDTIRDDINISHLKTLTMPKGWSNQSPKLTFPNISSGEQYRMAQLHLNNGIFIFDFLRQFLTLIQPYDIPIGPLTDTIDGRIHISTFISESIHVEAVLLVVIALCCILCCVLPGIELWFACRPLGENYKPTRHPGVLAFLLISFIFILGIGVIIMIMCNEAISTSVKKFSITAGAALHDLNNYHSSRTLQLRKCLSRSLDVASEAILADLDNIEELLGKPVQIDLSAETELSAALESLTYIANATHVVSSKVESLLIDVDNARNLGKHLDREIDDLRRNLEITLRACTSQDRSLCTVIDYSGLRLTLRMDQLLKDDHLIRLRNFNRENLTEIIRQARGEYLYIPQHIARNTLDVRNQIRREVNRMRGRNFEETRQMEASNSELVKQLDFIRHIIDYIVPYIAVSEHIRWLIGIGMAICVLLVWILLFGGACYRCSSAEDKVRPTLLCGVAVSCFVSIALWIVLMAILILSSHTEMLICRPLHDPTYHTMEAILESKPFFGRKLSVPLKELLEKCRENETVYPTFGFGNTDKLEQLTAYWTWSSLPRIMLQLEINLKTLRIFTPYLQQRLQNLLYACDLNLTEHRIMIQGPILNKDLDALSDQVEKIAHRMTDRLTARSLETIAINIQDLTLSRIKPLAKMQDELIYKLAGLELQVQPLQKYVNRSISHLKNIKYYIDSQGNSIAQMKTKIYKDRLNNYLDQWRSHVLSEMGSAISKCRPIWEILEGVKLLMCSHFLGNLNGYWFSVLLCAVIMIVAAPVAHILSLAYRKSPVTMKDTNVQPIRSENSQSNGSCQETWNSPEPPPPPPPQEGW